MTPSRRSQVEPFHVMEVIKAAAIRQATHGDVISLCAGQPSTPAPVVVREAAARAVREEVLGYTEATGIRPLREAIARHYADWYDIAVAPDEVIVTTGSSGGFTALFLAAFDPGDVVVMGRPGYPAYRNTLAALGVRVVEVDAGPASRYQPTVAMLEALAQPPAGVIVASPANPTGTIIDRDELAALAAWCEAHGSLLVSDEIYHGISFGRPCHSAWETSRSSAVIGSFSKYFSMTGWRLGWVLPPAELLRPMEVILGNLNICPPVLGQAAAVQAFSSAARDELDGHVARYAANRDLLLGALPTLGLGPIAPPDGAFYLYVDVRDHTADSQRWCADLLDATGVAITPGIDFAPHVAGGDPDLDGRSFVRISLAGSTNDLAQAVDRMQRWLTQSG